MTIVWFSKILTVSQKWFSIAAVLKLREWLQKRHGQLERWQSMWNCKPDLHFHTEVVEVNDVQSGGSWIKIFTGSNRVKLKACGFSLWIPSSLLLLLPAASWHLRPHPEESRSYDFAPSPPPGKKKEKRWTESDYQPVCGHALKQDSKGRRARHWMIYKKKYIPLPVHLPELELINLSFQGCVWKSPQDNKHTG